MLMLLSEYMAHIRTYYIYRRKRRHWWTICIYLYDGCCCLFMRPTFRLRYHHHCCVLVCLMNANALLFGSGVLIYMYVDKQKTRPPIYDSILYRILCVRNVRCRSFKRFLLCTRASRLYEEKRLCLLPTTLITAACTSCGMAHTESYTTLGL